MASTPISSGTANAQSDSSGASAANPTNGNGNTQDPKAQSANGSPPPSGVIIPDEAKQKYPDLVELVLQSESMNTEERNYWLQVMPVMTPDQIAELRDILETEKRKLAAIDAKYAAQKGGRTGGGQNTAALSEEDIKKAEEKRKKAQEERRAAEAAHREKDEEHAEDLLSQLDDL